MRGQVGGLKQAVRNAQDGISLIQTAEGALNETHSILNRMRELAVQASNDTNTQSDRLEIQKEINELSKEITRIADTTEFNTQNLLGGDFSAKFHIGANKDQNMDLTIGDMSAKELKVDGEEYTAQKWDALGLDVRSLTGEAIKINFAIFDDKDAGAVEKTSAKFENGEITVTLAQAAGDGTNAGAIKATHADVYKALESVAGKANIVFTKQEGFDGTKKK